MPKRAKLTYVGDRDDVLRTGGTPLWDEKSGSYVEGKYSASEYGGLFWVEIKRIVKLARLTPEEQAVFDGIARGLSDDDMARAKNCSNVTIRRHRMNALKKVRKVSNVGVLTSMVEGFGWKDTLENAELCRKT